jgi:uncharacterized protein (TIGR04255 family)
MLGSVLVRYPQLMARYANAPLRYVLFGAELRSAAVLGETAALDEIHAALKDALPVREDSSGPPVLRPPTGGARFVDGAQHRAVAVGPSMVTVDTTSYSTFGEFSAFLGLVFDAVASVAPGRAFQRLGLRYVDEIRIPDAQPGNVEQWREWINPELIPQVALKATASHREISGVIDDDRGRGFGVRFAWHTGTGHVVQPQGPLIVPNPSEAGPYFAIDTDSYWNFVPGADILALGDPVLKQHVDSLHDPVHEFFEMSLTDRLRDEILVPGKL